MLLIIKKNIYISRGLIVRCRIDMDKLIVFNNLIFVSLVPGKRLNELINIYTTNNNCITLLIVLINYVIRLHRFISSYIFVFYKIFSIRKWFGKR